MLTGKEKKDLQQKFQSYKHEVYVVSLEEMDAIIKSSPKGNKPSVKLLGKTIGAAVVMGGFTLAVGPILAVVAVGFGVSMLLEHADNSLGITNRVIAGLDELGESANNYISNQKQLL